MSDISPEVTRLLSASHRDRHRDSALVLALSAASLAGGLFLPLSLVYFTVLTDIPLARLGVLITAAGLVSVPLPVLAGWLVDRVGPRPLVTTALGLQALAYLGFVVVRQPLGVFVAAAVLAIGGRLFWSTVFALVAEHAEAHPVRPVESWFARINVVRTVGIVIGGLASGAVISLDQAGAYLALAWAAAACYAIAALLILLGRAAPGRPTVPYAPATSYSSLLRDRGFLALLATNAIFALSTLFAGLTLPTVVRSGLHGPGWLTSALLVANALLVAALGPRGGLLAARYAPLSLLRWAAVVWGAAFLVLALGVVATLPSAALLLFVAVAVLSVAEVLHAPASAALVNVMGGAHARGRYLAVFQYSFVAAELLGPILFTGLFGMAPALPFLILAGANALALPGLLGTGRLLGRARVAPQ